jgi:hypothetical protein
MMIDLDRRMSSLVARIKCIASPAIIHWLTGYDEQALQQQIDKKVDFETFFARAPRINPNVSKITGVICGYRVEEIEDKLMRQIRYLDKLVDELAKGKAIDKILRK